MSEDDFQKKIKIGKKIAINQLQTEITDANSSKDRIAAAKAMIEIDKDTSNPSVSVTFNMGDAVKDGLEGLKQIAKNSEVFIKDDEKDSEE